MPWLVFIYCSAHQLAHSRIWHILPYGNVFFRFFIKNFKFILIYFFEICILLIGRELYIGGFVLIFFFTLDENGSDKSPCRVNFLFIIKYAQYFIQMVFFGAYFLMKLQTYAYTM